MREGSGSASFARTDEGHNYVHRSQREPFWAIFRQFGSLRVVSAAAETLGLVGSPNLPLPLLGLDRAARSALETALNTLGLGA
ncbi:hypothetical protein E3O25_14070 [Cryobacterium sp. TMT1-3]|uniref:Uncharacterized protein n=1 Tax=Cryobacterium luteum TaxID=1424661 RepID=A0A1H8JE69_9MICO|nr:MULTISPECIES: hypothetical protein [Cryobacterium]TFB92318.1 hypothetical protein E3O10_04560 [Cryobacterium luteum]TFC25128.1 hypothetical protein E3O25_14070 [Cryobacterium sp. TMT1-3]SEN79012.1 4-hydroxy-tetrahydrodipicolinate synthase [Cryobacterium luteum]